MSAFHFVSLSKIHRRADARPLDDGAVDALADSIKKLELRSPIHVRLRADNDYELIAGSHRLAAYLKLGLAEIEVLEVSDDDLTAELAMIDENFVRAELSAGDRIRQTARRKAIHDTLFPGTSHGGDRRSDQVANLATCSFAAQTAAATSQSERTIRRDAERGEKVIVEVFDLLRGTVLDKGSYYDKIKDLPPNEQVHAAKRNLAFARKQEREGTGGRPSARRAAASTTEISQTIRVNYTQLLARLDEFLGLKPIDIMAMCPNRERAALCSRLSPLIDLFQAVMDEMAS